MQIFWLSDKSCIVTTIVFTLFRTKIFIINSQKNENFALKRFKSETIEILLLYEIRLDRSINFNDKIVEFLTTMIQVHLSKHQNTTKHLYVSNSPIPIDLWGFFKLVLILYPIFKPKIRPEINEIELVS